MEMKDNRLVIISEIVNGSMTAIYIDGNKCHEQYGSTSDEDFASICKKNIPDYSDAEVKFIVRFVDQKWRGRNLPDQIADIDEGDYLV